jgi:hypothetical protein
MHHFNSLAEVWRADADILERRGDQRGAALLRQVANELMEQVEGWQSESLTLREAAQESGYSIDRISELVLKGVVPNAGRKGKPRVRRGDLPRKAVRREAAVASSGSNPDIGDALFRDIVRTKIGLA